MELSHQGFIATWERHFKQPVHPLAARLLAATKYTVTLKEYDSECTAWHLNSSYVSFTIGFILPCDTDKWQIHLPSDFYTWAAKVPPSQVWFHNDEPPGSNFTHEYAKLTRHPLPDPFCALDVTLYPDGVGLDVFFGGEPCK